MKHSDISFLQQLEAIVNQRLEGPSDGSYTARLGASGTKRIAQKVCKEGVELALAAVAGNNDEVVDEAADLLYHLIVLLAQQNLNLGAVSKRLHTRHGGG